MMKRTEKDLKKIILSLSMLAMAACTGCNKLFVCEERWNLLIQPRPGGRFAGVYRDQF